MSGGRVGGAADAAEATQYQLHAHDVRRDPHFVVGVIDTGVVDVSAGGPTPQAHPFIHQALADCWVHNKDVLPPEGPLGPHDGHGTFVAGLIHYRAPAATIDVRNALDKAPHRADVADDIRNNDGRVAEQIRMLAGLDELRLVNLSFFGDGAPEREPPPEIRRALRHLFHHRPEVLVITAAGNHWTAAGTFPAMFAHEFGQVIAVGATDHTVTAVPALPFPRASFSSHWTGIHVYAPGVRVLGPYVSRSSTGAPPFIAGWCRWSGTSFAAATVTGLLAAAMMNEGLTGPQARERVIPRLFPPVPGTPRKHWKPSLIVGDSVPSGAPRNTGGTGAG